VGKLDARVVPMPGATDCTALDAGLGYTHAATGFGAGLLEQLQ